MHTSCSCREDKISSIYHLWGKYRNTSLRISFLSIYDSKMCSNQNIVNYKLVYLIELYNSDVLFIFI